MQPRSPDGSGNRGALAAEPGEPVAFLDEGGGYVPTDSAGWQLLVGDESAVPAILAILEQSHDTLVAEVFLEVATDADIRHEVTAPVDSKIHWLPRNGSSLQPGSLVLQTVRDTQLPAGPFYTWVAGESSMAGDPQSPCCRSKRFRVCYFVPRVLATRTICSRVTGALHETTD